MGKPSTIYKFTFEGQAYEMALGQTARLVRKSATFLKKRMDEDGFTMQQAIEAVPGDPQFRKKRRKVTVLNHKKNHLEKRQERFAEDNKDLFSKFFTGGMRHV